MKITLDNVGFSYPSGAAVLNGLSLEILAGEFVLVVGRNGAGKSTLLKLLNGILRPTSGSVTVAGHPTGSTPTATLAHHACVTFQNPADQIFAPTVFDEVAFAPRNLKHPNLQSLVGEALALCHLEPFKDHHPYDLPLAQRKLLTVASALASGAPFLAFDEPSAGLSQIEHHALEGIVKTLTARGVGFMVVSHDLSLFFRYATRVVVLEGGRCTFSGGVSELMQHEGVLRRAGLRLPVPLRIGRMLQRMQ